MGSAFVVIFCKWKVVSMGIIISWIWFVIISNNLNNFKYLIHDNHDILVFFWQCNDIFYNCMQNIQVLLRNIIFAYLCTLFTSFWHSYVLSLTLSSLSRRQNAAYIRSVWKCHPAKRPGHLSLCESVGRVNRSVSLLWHDRSVTQVTITQIRGGYIYDIWKSQNKYINANNCSKWNITLSGSE